MPNQYDRTESQENRAVSGSARPNERTAGDNTPRIAPLGELNDFQVAEGFPDVRGWDVVDAGRRKVGTVHELIVDTGAMRTRYLDVTLDKKAAGLDEERDVLVPIGAARLDDGGDNIILDAATAARLASFPAYTHQKLTREYEATVLPPGAAAATGADYYAGRHFDDSQFYAARRPRPTKSGKNEEARLTRAEQELSIGKRDAQAGEDKIKKTVES